MSILISVVVCTYNRCDLLEQVMHTLISQTYQKELHEIIIIDNNSKDDTPNVSSQLIKNNLGTNIRYILETKQGLSHARNRGWKEAKGEYIAYIDDDCKAPEQWLEVASKIINQYSPGVFGGPYYAFYNSPKPEWFKDIYGSRTWGDEDRILTESELSGGNIFFKRVLLEETGGFNPELGMKKNRIGYGEETVLQKYIRASKPNESIYYDPSLYVYHLVRNDKMSLRWRFRQQFARGKALYYYSFAETGDFKIYNEFKIAIKSVIILMLKLAYLFLRNRKKYPHIQNYMYESVSLNMIKFGRFYEAINSKIKK